ncbi:phytanoyl-CoA dioxygenase family protein [Paenibacillus psychroresistens]|uniref:phytanoyl-CoA dioxygenase family protein n=1 Tax=Paenibacillus psychroresistens TaxID=1778678 RepID=UPI00221F82FB|nr:phytanoyl-CoA dioxygenase family protein [Paenibacillus psychroresistens]
MQKAQTQPLPELTSDYDISVEQVEHFEGNGHICLREVASLEEVTAYREVIGQIVQQSAKQADPISTRNTYGKAFIQVTNLWERSEEVKKFSFARRFAKIAAELMGVDGVRMYHDQALYKEAGGGHTPWHQDQVLWPIDEKDDYDVDAFGRYLCRGRLNDFRVRQSKAGICR